MPSLVVCDVSVKDEHRGIVPRMQVTIHLIMMTSFEIKMVYNSQ